MSKMETETPISVVDCFERLRKCAEIEGHNFVASNYQGLDKLPDTAEKQELKEILSVLPWKTLYGKRLIGPDALNVVKEHPTKQYTIKEKQDIPYCIIAGNTATRPVIPSGRNSQTKNRLTLTSNVRQGRSFLR
ncbi:hypothetical protein TNCV_4391711 [Trichonephila clavipes]|nr:hypothetical protein TNCV_4391711 [Trichonephila clavipes]